jgi:putative membrane protein
MTELAAPAPTTSPEADRRFFVLTAIISVVALSLLGYLLLLHEGAVDSGLDLRFMPAVNTVFNAGATLCLIAGFVAVRRRKLDVHRRFMLGAYVCSALFLVGYLAYHYVHGDTKFGGEGVVRVVYLFILATHIILSMFILPMALLAFWFAWKQQYRRHTRTTRVLLPIWLYVSITGIVVFFMLHGPRYFGS